MKYPVIYDGFETNFNHYGLGVLNDVIECTVTEELNGLFECEFTYFSNSRLANFIQEENIVKVNANYNFKGQLFRVYRVVKSVNGICKAQCQHISYDLVDDFVKVLDVKTVSVSSALQRMLDNSLFCKRFKAHSDINTCNDVFMQHSSIMEAIKGSNGSLSDVWNGFDLYRDNFNIHMLKKRGQEKELLLHEKKNIVDLEFDLDYTDMCTVIYPFARIKEEWNGFDKTITYKDSFIYSPNHEKYRKKYIKPIDFTSDKIRSSDDLKREADKYFARNNVDVPINNLKVKSVNENIGLGDTLIVKVPKIGIDISVRVVKVKFNPILNKVTDIELGDLKKFNRKG